MNKSTELILDWRTGEVVVNENEIITHEIIKALTFLYHQNIEDFTPCLESKQYKDCHSIIKINQQIDGLDLGI